jgi:hypothetical protein
VIWTHLPFLQTAAYGAIFIAVGIFFPGGVIRTRFFAKLPRRPATPSIPLKCP